jgi:hypothetical protein
MNRRSFLKTLSLAFVGLPLNRCKRDTTHREPPSVPPGQTAESDYDRHYRERIEWERKTFPLNEYDEYWKQVRANQIKYGFPGPWGACPSYLEEPCRKTAEILNKAFES